MSVSEIIQGMQSKFNASAATGLDLVFQFNIEDGENHYLIIKEGECAAHVGESDSPNVTLSMDTATLASVMNGETDGMQAFMTGKLRAEGDMMLALKLSELFPV